MHRHPCLTGNCVSLIDPSGGLNKHRLTVKHGRNRRIRLNGSSAGRRFCFKWLQMLKELTMTVPGFEHYRRWVAQRSRQGIFLARETEIREAVKDCETVTLGRIQYVSPSVNEKTLLNVQHQEKIVVVLNCQDLSGPLTLLTSTRELRQVSNG